MDFAGDDLEGLAVQSEMPAGNGKSMTLYRRRYIGGRKAAAEYQNGEPYTREN